MERLLEHLAPNWATGLHRWFYIHETYHEKDTIFVAAGNTHFFYT